MSRKPRALVLWTPGTNCHEEMVFAFSEAGAIAEIVTLNQLSGNRSLCEGDLIGLPGGFSYGDHFGSGRVAALDFCLRFQDQLLEALERKIPMIGICNGFQILVAMGLLPGGGSVENPTAALDFNLRGNFEHWHDVKLVLYEPEGSDSVWTKGLAGQVISVPVGHGEGRLVTDEPVRVIATYGTAGGDASYPASPNGCPVAGISDSSSLIMGMMPHPERRVDDLHGGSGGLLIFQSGVNAVR
jgi:phosphoribosylformylglycinamidine synthase